MSKPNWSLAAAILVASCGGSQAVPDLPRPRDVEVRIESSEPIRARCYLNDTNAALLCTVATFGEETTPDSFQRTVSVTLHNAAQGQGFRCCVQRVGGEVVLSEPRTMPGADQPDVTMTMNGGEFL